MMAQTPAHTIVPRARHVTLRPYTALHTTIIPNLGLRLVFPSSLSRSVVLAVTNPLFRATVLPRNGGIVLVAHGGFRHRYCTNVFVSLGRFHVSLLACTASVARHYVSDIVFGAPKQMRRKYHGPRRVSVWAPIVARLLCAPPRHHLIRKRVALHAATETVIFDVRASVRIGRHLLFITEVHAHPKPVQILGLALYANTPWRIHSTRFRCAAHQGLDVGCVIVAPHPLAPVSRWHMVLVTEDGSVSISW